MKQLLEFKKFYLVFLLGIFILSSGGCLKSFTKDQNQLRSYPIAGDVFTTAQRTIIPKPTLEVEVKLKDVAKYKRYGYGSWFFA